jgi:uracil-DNA glycosylase
MVQGDLNWSSKLEGALGDWVDPLKSVLDTPSFNKLADFIREERRLYDVFPSKEDTFKAFRLTPAEKVKVVILGQDCVFIG